MIIAPEAVEPPRRPAPVTAPAAPGRPPGLLVVAAGVAAAAAAIPLVYLVVRAAGGGFEGMLEIAERVIPLPTHLSVGAEQPLSFSKEYIYQSLI